MKELKRKMPPDLAEARQLLESFVRSKSHSERTRDFEDAIEILNGPIQDGLEASHRQIAENLKSTFTRKLLEELPSLADLDMNEWFDYSKLLLLSIPKEVEKLIEHHPKLNKNKEEFLSIWADEAIVLLQKAKGRHP